MIDSCEIRKLQLTLFDFEDKTDWFRVITDLQRHGYGFRAIGAVVWAGKSTVRGWYMGANPNFESGMRLVTLWSRITGNGRDNAPRVSRYSYRA